jgi:hypothetical protein
VQQNATVVSTLDSGTISTSNAKTVSGTTTKGTAASNKTKAGQGNRKAGGGQRGASGAKPSAGAAKTGVSIPVESKMPVQQPVKRGLPRDVRLALMLFVFSLVFMASLYAFRQFAGPMSIKDALHGMFKDSSQSIPPPAAGSDPANEKSAGAKRQAEKKTTGKKGKQALTAVTLDADDDFDSESTVKKGASESEYILSRPVSRFMSKNSGLYPLAEISTALDRNHPRKAVNLLRQLSPQFGSKSSNEKNALREIMVRYYLQVGSYSKSVLLAKQVCADPAKASDVESCLHAARAFLMTGDYEELKETLQALNVRMVQEKTPWYEWSKLLETASALEKPTSENLLRFSEEYIEKSPYLTIEWNLQLSVYFARVLLSASDQVRYEFLKSLSGSRKKNFEVKLAPDQYSAESLTSLFPSLLNILLRHYELGPLNVQRDQTESNSDSGLVAWMFSVISQSKVSEPLETRARLAPLFAEKNFSPLARLIEGNLAVQAGDYVGASNMIVEQIGMTSDPAPTANSAAAKNRISEQFLKITERLEDMPFLYVEWLFLGVKVASGLVDVDSMKNFVLALQDARRRFPELQNEFQYWQMMAVGQKLLGQTADFENTLRETQRLMSSPDEKGYVAADQVWLMMKKGMKLEGRALFKQALKNFPYHVKLLEVGSQFAVQWNEDPMKYMKLEVDVPSKFVERGRDKKLLSFFTMLKLLNHL